MLINTKHFGKIEAEESEILFFEDGLPGFEGMTKYILINSSEQDSPFKWLQSVEEQQLAFAIIDPFAISKDYSFELDVETGKRLDVKKAEDIAIFSIVVVPEDLRKISMNLKAPVIININNHKAAQIVLDTDKYSVRHYILDELREQGVDTDAGANKKKGSDDSHK